MSRNRIIPSSLRSSLLSRKHSPSVLRPPAFLLPRATTARSRLGLHPHASHLSLPPFTWTSTTLTRTFSTSPHFSSQSPRFTYALAASYSDKRHKLDLLANHTPYNPAAAPSRTHDSARPASGQDAFFMAPVGEGGSIAFGVVDGVGGWEESGVDPADFAHGLCEYMSDAARGFPYGIDSAAKKDAGNVDSMKGVLKSVDLLEVGYERVMDDERIPAGGCTACIGTLSPAGLLSVANLGDSGYIHLRPFALTHLSPAQTHRFNTPFQLSKLPPQMLKQVALFGGAKPYSEVPSDSALSSRQLEHGDVVAFATDGVWDNLSAEDALRVVSRVMVRVGAWIPPSSSSSEEDSHSSSTASSDKGPVPPNFRDIISTASLKIPPTSSSSSANSEGEIKGLASVLASALTHEAKVASLDRKRDGPFAREVQRLYPEENWRGGKADDICVVVGVVCQEGV